MPPISPPYRYVYWPESFQAGDLPWEAAAVVLELMEDHRQRHQRAPDIWTERPTVRLARWFWRVTQAAPDAPKGWRSEFAGALARAEALGTLGRTARNVEKLLLEWHPWRSEADLRRYVEALVIGEAPWPMAEPPERGQISPEDVIRALMEGGFTDSFARSVAGVPEPGEKEQDGQAS